MSCQESPDGVTFPVRVVPNGRRDEILAVTDGVLKVRVHAPPVEGKANEALVKYLAKMLGVKSRDVEMLGGERARLKQIKVQGLGGRELKEMLYRRAKGDKE